MKKMRPSANVLLLALSVLALSACLNARVEKVPAHAIGPKSATSGTPAPKVSQPKYGKTLTVEKGVTLYHYAVSNGISPMDLALWNDIAPPYTIYPGQTLRLYPRDAKTPPPPPAGPGASSPSTGAPVFETVSPPGAQQSVTTVKTPSGKPAATITTTPAAGASPAGQPVAASASATQAAVSSQPAQASGDVRWRWPAEGNVVAGFVAGDPAQQGVDIAGKLGQPVRATADGVVVYSGSGLVGYGELIIIKHDEQWLSAYGHNSKRLVNEGQLVKAGQQIAEMGHSGASRDELHFEIRYNGKPVDPQDYLPKK